jgi:hypothetical protein
MSKPAKRCPKWFPDLYRAIHTPSSDSDALSDAVDPDQVTERKEKKEAFQVFMDFWTRWRYYWMAHQPPSKPRKKKTTASSNESSKESANEGGGGEEKNDEDDEDNVSHERPSKKRKSASTPLPVRHKLNRIEQVMDQADQEFQTRFGKTQQVNVTEVKAWFESVQSEFYHVIHSSPTAMSPTSSVSSLSPSPHPPPLAPSIVVSSSSSSAAASSASVTTSLSS